MAKPMHLAMGGAAVCSQKRKIWAIDRAHPPEIFAKFAGENCCKRCMEIFKDLCQPKADIKMNFYAKLTNGTWLYIRTPSMVEAASLIQSFVKGFNAAAGGGPDLTCEEMVSYPPNGCPPVNDMVMLP